MSLLSIAYLAMVIVAFATFAVSLFWVQLYANAKDKARPSEVAPAPAEAAPELRRAA